MAKTPQQTQPDPRNWQPNYNRSPLTYIEPTGQGTLSHPKPPKPIVLERNLLPAPTPVNAPGAKGTI